MTTTKGHDLNQAEFAAEVSRLSRRESDLFRDYMRNLPEKKWLNMSFCTDWTIKDVVEHNVVAGMGFLSVIRRALKGETDLEYNKEFADSFEPQITNLNRLELANKLAEDTHEMYDLLEKANPEILNMPVKLRYGSVPLSQLGNMRLNELSLHSWDVRVVDDLTAKVSRDTLPLILPTLVKIMPGLANRPTLEKIDSLSYQFEITGSVTGPAAFKVASGKPISAPEYVDNPDVTMKIDADAFLRLAWGRLKVDWMIKNGWLKVEGDKDAALKLTQIFQGV